MVNKTNDSINNTLSIPNSTSVTTNNLINQKNNIVLETNVNNTLENIDKKKEITNIINNNSSILSYPASTDVTFMNNYTANLTYPQYYPQAQFTGNQSFNYNNVGVYNHHYYINSSTLNNTNRNYSPYIDTNYISTLDNNLTNVLGGGITNKNLNLEVINETKNVQQNKNVKSKEESNKEQQKNSLSYIYGGQVNS